MGTFKYLKRLDVAKKMEHVQGGDHAAADQQELVALRDAASWMEKRIDNLESVLDTEAPGWRARSATR